MLYIQLINVLPHLPTIKLSFKLQLLPSKWLRFWGTVWQSPQQIVAQFPGFDEFLTVPLKSKFKKILHQLVCECACLLS